MSTIFICFFFAKYYLQEEKGPSVRTVLFDFRSVVRQCLRFGFAADFLLAGRNEHAKQAEDANECCASGDHGDLHAF